MLFTAMNESVTPGQTAQATGPNAARRALILGLGSTGYETIIKLRRFLLERYGTMRDLPIRFLCLETHGGKRQEAITPYDHMELPLQDDEWLHLDVTGAANADLEGMPGLRTWVPRSAIAANIRNGAGNSRIRGRLSFFWNYNAVADRLRRQWEEVTRYKRDDGQKNDVVYVVGTLGGGTCSGCFVDVGYALRYLLEDPVPELIGYFSLVGSNANQVLQANCYAALKELNHFNSGSTPYHALHLDNTVIHHSADEYPYDLPYLISSESGPAGYALTEEQIAEMVALDIFGDMASPQFANKRTGGRDNIQEQAVRETDLLGCPKRYLTFGLAMIHFPAYKYRRACAARLGQDLVGEWLRTSGNVSVNGLLQDTRRLMVQRGLLTEPNKSNLAGSRLQLQVWGNEKLASWCDDWVTGLREKFDELCRNGNHTQLMEWLRTSHERELLPHYIDMDRARTVTDEEACSLLSRPVPGITSTVKKHVHQLAQDQLQTARGYLEQVVSDCINEPGYRVENTLRIFDTVKQELGRELVASREASRLYFKDAGRREALWQRGLSAVQGTADSMAVSMVTLGHPTSSVKQAAAKALDLCHKWHTRQTQAVLEEYMGFVYLSLIQHVGVLEQQVRDYQGLLQAAARELEQQEKSYTDQPPLLTGETVEPQGNSSDPVGATAQTGNTEAARREVERSVLRELSGKPEAFLFDLKNRQPGELAAMIMRQALPQFDYLHRDMDVCEEWLKQHPDARERVNAFRKVFDDADIHMGFQPDQNFVPTGRENQVLIAYHGLSKASNDAIETLVNGLALPSDQKDHLGDIGQDPFRLVMLREYGGFPLRVWRGLSALRQAFERRRAADADLMRSDVERWFPVEDVPSSAVQADIWRDLLAGWALGAVSLDATDERPVFGYVYRDEEGEKSLRTAPWGQPPPVSQGRRADGIRLTPQPGQGILPPVEMLPVVYSVHEQGAEKLQAAVQEALRKFVRQHGEYAGVSLFGLFASFKRQQSGRDFIEFMAGPLDDFITRADVKKPANERASRVDWPKPPVQLSVSRGPQRLPVQAYDEHDAQLGAVMTQLSILSGDAAVALDATGLLVPKQVGQARVLLQIHNTKGGTLEHELEVEVV